MPMSSSTIYPSFGSENNIKNWTEYKGPPIYLASSPAQYTSSKETSTTLPLGPVDSRVPICPPTDPSPTGSMESSTNSVPSYLSTPGGGPSEAPIESPRKHKRGESSEDSSKPRKDMYTCLCGDWGMGKHSCYFYVGRRQLTRQRITDVLEKIPRVDSAPRRNSAKENKEAVTKRWKGIWKNVLEDIIEYEGKQAEMMNDGELVEAMKEAFTRRTGDYQANYQATILAGSYFPVMEDVWDSDEEEMKEDDYAHEALWDAGVDWVDTVMSR
ncbi:hypothetical protein FPQ18DRAFT_405591 [Pyronema domesticum]|nr:hypothetical protein FPQ18DRAFT_405591 [Pyronema domesticum]